ncbi:MAG: hypothetical protein CMK59_04820 [Proteobacteria bacterium]|nr:hypothetical protein [Pseudomonadota bacterium]
MRKTLRGRILMPLKQGFEYLEDGLIHIENGLILKVESTPADSNYSKTHTDSILMPAFTDSHIHFPQTMICGSASGPLLTWLNTSTFPEEAKFAHSVYARDVAQIFCRNVLRAGVSSVAAYSSAHKSSTHELFCALDSFGLKGLAGMVLMNRNAPDEILFGPEEAKDHMIELVEQWHGHDNQRLRYCVTPRFAISCDSQMMTMAGQFAQEHDLWLQTHVSENQDEVDFTCSLYPESGSYLKIYRDFGMLHKRSIYAHCIYFDEADWLLFCESRAVVAHCPDSNFFLGSGCMNVRQAQAHGVRLSIGTDVGAGRSFSMRIAAARAYDASLMVQAPFPPEEILWSATIGGAQELGFNSGWSQGADADIVAVRCPIYDKKDQIIDHILFRHDEPDVEETYIRGELCYQKTSEGEWFKGEETNP